VAIVKNTSDGIWGADEGWTVEQELLIGALEGDPEYQFGQVGGLTVDSEGRIYALDVQAQHIKVYSPEGEYLSTIGGQGRGPGELFQAFFLVMGPGDTLLVPDVGNQRINRFAPDGSSLGDIRIEMAKGIPMVFGSSSNGAMAEQVRQFSFPGQPEIEEPKDFIIVLGADALPSDTLLTYPAGETFSLTGGRPEFKIYSTEAAWDLTDDSRLVFATNDEYRFNTYATGGVLERIVEKPFERRPVTERDKQPVLDLLQGAWDDAGVPPEMRPEVKFGEFLPTFGSIVAGPLGTVWVQNIRPFADRSDEELENFDPLQDSGSPEWDIFDSEGRFLGVVNLPDKFAPREFRGDKIYGVWRDELDVSYVMRLRIIGLEGATT
jgi:hypothetical protein